MLAFARMKTEIKEAALIVMATRANFQLCKNSKVRSHDNFILQVLEARWRYLGEGGANIVFSFAGHPSSALFGKALRVPLCNPSDSLAEYQKGLGQIFHRILGDCVVNCLELLTLPMIWVENLLESVRADRSQERIDRVWKRAANEQVFGTLLPDLTVIVCDEEVSNA